MSEATTRRTAPRIVICDDDQTLRMAIVRLAASAGLHVVAETDDAREAVELVDRFSAHVLVVDLSLNGGRGEDALSLIRSRNLSCRPIVFSAYASDPAQLLEAGAAVVVEKPDFQRLEEALLEQAKFEFAPSGPEKRRKLSDRPSLPVPSTMSPSGLASAEAFKPLIAALLPGDVVLVLRVSGPQSVPPTSLIAADRLLEAARVAKSTLRLQDRMGAADDAEITLLLCDGDQDAARSVYERVYRSWSSRVSGLGLQGGWTLVRPGEHPGEAVQRAASMLRSQSGDDAGRALHGG